MGVYKGVSTTELDELAAETAAHLTSEVMLPRQTCRRSLPESTSAALNAPCGGVYVVMDATLVTAPGLWSACGAHQCEQPAQEHQQELHRNRDVAVQLRRVQDEVGRAPLGQEGKS